MALDKQEQDTQEYYGNYPNFRVASGIKIPDGDLKGEYVDYSVTTDNLQGIAWYKNGDQKLVVNNCSYEYDVSYTHLTLPTTPYV